MWRGECEFEDLPCLTTPFLLVPIPLPLSFPLRFLLPFSIPLPLSLSLALPFPLPSLSLPPFQNLDCCHRPTQQIVLLVVAQHVDHARRRNGAGQRRCGPGQGCRGVGGVPGQREVE
ncbi:hypothetical protein M427DRAFT_141551 [Gonapodya prolifera JEL478]|uniref:Uncharacterized protein n=1 Tax=Gonapodya prolifera (strain JEL478) TaxID=1344416 RepID=A0A138ZWV8_GONPJ|nr:hypothetical protein M427DRAFT_141551 [Gonapodya prolifera JEL478]|eukprot:KXS08986.1 hypothetical protein M427DRAFT_141551 [Gonapodya prolifera JEL478]